MASPLNVEISRSSPRFLANPPSLAMKMKPASPFGSTVPCRHFTSCAAAPVVANNRAVSSPIKEFFIAGPAVLAVLGDGRIHRHIFAPSRRKFHAGLEVFAAGGALRLHFQCLR